MVLTAGAMQLQLPGGGTVDALAFDSQVPGPELRLRQGDLADVELRNDDVAAGVTVHWHGIDVPAAEDGVPGLTQAPVPGGGSQVYRFVPDRADTVWCHSHVNSAEQVGRGLFGVVVVEPRDGTAEDVDIALPVHAWEDAGLETVTLGSCDVRQTREVEPGDSVRVRLVGAGGSSALLTVAGSPLRVAATDGNDVTGAAELAPGTRLPLAAGARTDVVLEMPRTPVLVALASGSSSGFLLVPPGQGDTAAPDVPDGAVFDRLSYGSAGPTPFDASTPADVEAEKVLDARLTAAGGAPAFGFTINGGSGPTAPTLLVEEGDLVRVRIVNRSFVEHTMHLHGHRVLVLSRDGEPVTGSP